MSAFLRGDVTKLVAMDSTSAGPANGKELHGQHGVAHNATPPQMMADASTQRALAQAKVAATAARKQATAERKRADRAEASKAALERKMSSLGSMAHQGGKESAHAAVPVACVDESALEAGSISVRQAQATVSAAGCKSPSQTATRAQGRQQRQEAAQASAYTPLHTCEPTGHGMGVQFLGPASVTPTDEGPMQLYLQSVLTQRRAQWRQESVRRIALEQELLVQHELMAQRWIMECRLAEAEGMDAEDAALCASSRIRHLISKQEPVELAEGCQCFSTGQPMDALAPLPASDGFGSGLDSALQDLAFPAAAVWRPPPTSPFNAVLMGNDAPLRSSQCSSSASCNNEGSGHGSHSHSVRGEGQVRYTRCAYSPTGSARRPIGAMAACTANAAAAASPKRAHRPPPTSSVRAQRRLAMPQRLGSQRLPQRLAQSSSAPQLIDVREPWREQLSALTDY